MAGEHAFEVEGGVVEARPNGTFKVRLCNGHELLGYMTARTRRELDPVRPGESVRLKLSPFDLSEGRIIGKTKSLGL